MLVNREIILAKIEAAYNTDSLPVEGDAILVENPNWSNEGLRMNERNSIRGNLGKLQQIFGGRLMSISFDVEIKGSGSPGVAPEIGTLLRACALGETIVALTSVAYSPVSTGHESITLYYYRDGKLIILTGCRGNVNPQLETGPQGKMSFTFTGHVASESDTPMISPAYDNTVPTPVIGAGFSIGGYSAVISSLNFDLSNTLATPPDISSSDGYGEVRITGRDVNGSFDPEDTLIADNDWQNDFELGNTLALDTGLIGSVVGNRYQITMPAVYYRDLSPGDRDGVRTLDVGCGMAESAGDDEFTLIFS